MRRDHTAACRALHRRSLQNAGPLQPGWTNRNAWHSVGCHVKGYQLSATEKAMSSCVACACTYCRCWQQKLPALQTIRRLHSLGSKPASYDNNVRQMKLLCRFWDDALGLLRR